MKSLCTALVVVFLTPNSAAACDAPPLGSDTFAWRTPVSEEAVRFTASYGLMRHPLLATDTLHAGVDWSGPIGTGVSAAAHGRVSMAGREGEYGLSVRLDHGGGWSTLYAHLSRIAPEIVPGACVRAGAIVGAIGSTGLTAGPHLHFEVQREGVAVDPMRLLRADR